MQKSSCIRNYERPSHIFWRGDEGSPKLREDLSRLWVCETSRVIGRRPSRFKPAFVSSVPPARNPFRNFSLGRVAPRRACMILSVNSLFDGLLRGAFIYSFPRVIATRIAFPSINVRPAANALDWDRWYVRTDFPNVPFQEIVPIRPVILRERRNRSTSDYSSKLAQWPRSKSSSDPL